MSGPDEAPLVVFSHGAWADHRMFEPQVRAVVAAGYRALTWDARGHGCSKPLGRTPLTTADLAADLLAVINAAHAPEQICLVGQSLGGLVTQEFLLANPARAGAAVMIASTSATSSRSLIESLPLWVFSGFVRWWPEGALRRWAAQTTAVKPEVQAYAYDAARQLSRTELIAVWDAVSRSAHRRLDVRIKSPLLLVHGDKDLSGGWATRRWAGREEGCRYEVIRDAGHNANQDNPDAFNRILLDFVSRHYPAS